MKKVLIGLLCAAVIIGAMIWVAVNREKEETVSVAYFDNITHGQALIMKHNQTLQNMLGDDVDVSWVSFNAGPAEVEACFSGDIDIGYIGPVPAATAYTKSDGDFIIISGVTNGGAMLIARKDAKIHSVEDLKGRTVSVPQLGNTQHLLLLDLMKKNNLSAVSEGGNVKVIEAQNADVVNLFRSGDVDAALVPEPWGTTILKETDADIVLDYDQLNSGKDYSTAVVMVNKQYMKEHEEIVKKFLQAHIDATNYIVSKPEEAALVMNEQLDEDTGKSLKEDVINEAIKRIDYNYEIPKASIMDYSGLCLEQKFIDAELKEDAFDGRLLEQLSK